MEATEGRPARGPWVLGLRFVGLWLVGLPLAVRATLALAWMGMIWALSSQTFPALPARPGLWAVFANLAHAPLFGILALLVAALVLRAREGESWRRIGPRDVVSILGAVALYGVLDEWHQGHTPGRHPSVFDLAIDLVGASSVVWIVAYLGSVRASELGLRLRLLSCVLACAVAASIESALAGVE